MNSNKMIETIIGIVAFIIGLTFYVDYSSPYYEMRGAFVIEQRVLGVGFVYTWSGPGFRDNYPSDWNIYRTKDRPTSVR